MCDIDDETGGGPTAKPVHKPRRISPADRKRQIVEAAAAHFAEVGFGGGTREIASRVGVTQPLLYRYFPDKESLIEAVYRSVYLESWDPAWDRELADRSRSVRARSECFYRHYVAANFNRRWLRIAFFAGLRDAKIHERHNARIEDTILKRIVREHRVELGICDKPEVSPEELEPAWQMHGGLLHYGWRRVVLNLQTSNDSAQVISDALDMYFSTAKNIYFRATNHKVDMK